MENSGVPFSVHNKNSMLSTICLDAVTVLCRTSVGHHLPKVGVDPVSWLCCFSFFDNSGVLLMSMMRAKSLFVVVSFFDLNLKQPRITLEENVSEELSRSG